MATISLIDSRTKVHSALESMKPNRTEFAGQLNNLAAQLSTFAPVLENINDQESFRPEIHGQLEMISGLSRYINEELSRMAIEVVALDKQAV